MSSLRVVEANLPPGFRFHPSDEELICDYLIKWVMGCAAAHPLLVQVDLNNCEPWDIPETACVGGKEWYFYSQRDRKYATGLRTNRATASGYWKATGKDRPIILKGNLVGMRKTLVFYQGRAPKGRKTDWVMHEYRLEGIYQKTPYPAKEDWVLCRMFFKNQSQVPGKFQETGNEITPSSPSLPALMEPYNNSVTFDYTQTNSHDVYKDQVPCFSIFSTNQTSPTFSILDRMEDLPDINSCGDHLGTYENSPSLPINNDPYSSSCDEEVIKAVLSQLTKIESVNEESLSFGGGSSDSYLSELWNQN